MHKSFVEPCPVPAQRIDLGGFAMNAVDAGSGPAIVFLHGLGWDHTLWGRQIARLADRHRVISADTRGHGETDKPEGPYSIAQFTDDWIALLDALGVSSAVLVGFSLGGMIAQAIAAQRPDLVRGLILVNTTCETPAVGREHMEARFAAMRSGGGEAAAHVAARSIFSAPWREAHPGDVASFVEWRTGHDQAALIEVMRAVSQFDLRDKIMGVRVPTLVVTALEDAMMPPDVQAPLVELIAGAAHVEVEGSGHMLSIEQPSVFDSIIDGFLEARSRQ